MMIEKHETMIIDTLIVSLILAGIMGLALGLKLWLQPEGNAGNKSGGKNSESPEAFSCAHCGIKEISDCSIRDKRKEPVPY